MRIRLAALIVISIAALLLSGCVMKGAYDSKVQENQLLGKNLEESKASLQQLQAQHDALADASDMQTAELKALSAEAAALKVKNEQLEEALQPGNLLATLSAFIDALQQQIDQLKSENVELKRKEAAAQEPPVAATPVEESLPDVVVSSEADAEVVPVDADPVVTAPAPIPAAVETPVEAKRAEVAAEPEPVTAVVPVAVEPVATESVSEPVETAPAAEEMPEVTAEPAAEPSAEAGAVEAESNVTPVN